MLPFLELQGRSLEFKRNKFAKIGYNKITKNMYKLDTIYYNTVKLKRGGDVMTDLDSLKRLVRENGYLYTKDVTDAGIRREQLKKYLRKEGYDL